jgi:hypothetical protein
LHQPPTTKRSALSEPKAPHDSKYPICLACPFSDQPWPTHTVLRAPATGPTCGQEKDDEEPLLYMLKPASVALRTVTLNYTRIFSSYCAVNVLLGYEKVTDWAMAQAVSRRPLTAETWVRSQATLGHVRFVVDKVALGRVLLPAGQFPLSVPFHQRSTLSFIYMLPL